MSHPAYAPEQATPPMSQPDTPMMSQPTSYTLPRPGQRPLIFSGTELAMAMSFTPELPYWYEINIYRTQDQRFALAIRLFFQSENEENVVKGWDFDMIEEVFDALETYDAAKDVKVTWTELESTAPAELVALSLELQAKVQAARANFKGLVGEMLKDMEQASGMAA
jgi:hypothetical protein